MAASSVTRATRNVAIQAASIRALSTAELHIDVSCVARRFAAFFLCREGISQSPSAYFAEDTIG
jgi:hypothetical protein